MRVAVVGGTGVLGRLVVGELAQRGDEVRVLSRSAPSDRQRGAEHRRVDLATGAGLADALDGVEAVVDAVNDTSRRAANVLVEGSRRLLAAERDAAVRHHLAISIVGCDRVPFGYYRAKVAQEQVVRAGPTPWSLLRATQFHDLVAAFLGAAERLRLAPVAPLPIQPIDAPIVARRLVDAVHDGPGGELPELAGPQIETLAELSDAWRLRRGRRLARVRIPLPGRMGRALRDGAVCNEAAATPGPTFADWLATRA